MTDQLADPEPEEPKEFRVGPLTRLRRRIAPEIPSPLDDMSKKDIRCALARSGDGLSAHFLEQARLRYDDVFKRAENVERRASALQASLVFAVTLTLTGGALLLDSSKVSSHVWRDVLALSVLAIVASFVWAGLHAALAATRTQYWKVVGKFSLHGRTFKSLAEAQQYRAAAYLWCVQRNMPVNRWKADELGRALRAFLVGIIGLAVLAALLAAFALGHAPAPPKPLPNV